MVSLKSIFKKIVLPVFIFSVFLGAGKSSFAEPLNFDIIVPVNEKYDPYPLKKLETEFFNTVFPTGSNTAPDLSLSRDDFSTDEDYARYQEIVTARQENGENLIDEDGYYYPTLTLHIGSGNTEDLITLSTSILRYYLVSEDGDIINQDEVGSSTEKEAFARIYSVEGFESNNVQIGDKNSNVKYDVTYRSDYTLDGDTVDVFHVVKSATDDKESWMFLTEGLITETDDDLYPLIVVNAMNRTYFDPNGPSVDKNGVYTWTYYQEVDGLRLIPINPEKDGDCFTVVHFDENTPADNNTLPLKGAGNIESYKVLIEGSLIESDAVYFDYYKDLLNITNEVRELENVSYEIRVSDGASDIANGEILASEVKNISGLFYNFQFYADYNTLLNQNTDTFDIVLKGSSSNSTGSNKVTVTVVLDDIKLPKINIDKINVSNNTTKKLWDSIGLDSTAATTYSTANFTAGSDDAIPTIRDNDGNDGNYAKAGDSISISIGYTASCGEYKLSENSYITLFLDNNILNITPSLITETDAAYNVSLNNFIGGGIAYLVLKNTIDPSNMGDNEKIELLYIDNIEASDEAVALDPGGTIYPEYINASVANTLSYSSSEDIPFNPSSSTRELTKLTQGITGVRAFLTIFDYDSSKSDIERYNTEVDPDIINPVPHNSTLNSIPYGDHYYRIVANSTFEESVALDSHNNDGAYTVVKLIAIDKAGNIETENKENIDTILSQLSNAGLSGTVYEYFVDTIDPYIKVSLEKIADANGLPLSGNVPFKNKDTLRLALDLHDYNLYSYRTTALNPVLTNSGLTSNPDFSFPIAETKHEVDSLENISIDFTVENSTDTTSAGHIFGTATAKDKAGNESTASLIGELTNTIPTPVYIELYEQYWGDNWTNSATNILGDGTLSAADGTNTYSFSKGALKSNSSKPDIYITGIDTTGTDRVQFLKINIAGKGEVFYDHTLTTTTPEDLRLEEINSNDSNITNFYLIPNSKNIMTVTPVGPSGILGISYNPSGNVNSTYAVIDTEVNSDAMDTQTMNTAELNNSTGNYEFKLDFSNILELSGLKGYKIEGVTSSGNSISTSVVNYPTGETSLGSNYANHMALSATPSANLVSASIEKVITIDKDDLMQGSRAVLKVSVIDSLGSKKTFDLHYLLEEPSVELKAKTNNSNRLRKSYIRLVGDDGNKGFKVETLEETGE